MLQNDFDMVGTIICSIGVLIGLFSIVLWIRRWIKGEKAPKAILMIAFSMLVLYFFIRGLLQYLQLI